VPELKSTLLKTSRLFYGVCFDLAKASNNQREPGTMEKEKTFLKSRDTGTIKVKLNAYKHNGTLKREFSSFEQAQKIAKHMAKKYPDMIFEPFIEQEDSLKLDSYDSWEEKLIQPHKKPDYSFVDRISELFENED
jgi:hypothetical protein